MSSTNLNDTTNTNDDNLRKEWRPRHMYRTRYVKIHFTKTRAAPRGFLSPYPPSLLFAAKLETTFTFSVGDLIFPPPATPANIVLPRATEFFKVH